VLSLLLDEVEEEIGPGSASVETVLVGAVGVMVEGDVFGLKFVPG